MSTRKCTVCSGTGTLWGIPPLIETGGLDSSKVTRLQSDTADISYGVSVMCWRCVGKGYVPDDRRDEGETNG